ncbi:MAG: SDR family oxidoreductase [Ectothiorhodospiraceae bacterium]|nr:SDR family oxidoreductase [Chromatiales bacterium]MCP5156335.1 SDR family oxidoreductase [Ectothiorhodospiraceae bacterium]
MSDKPLAGKAALVTGSARNIGRAIALALAEDGAAVMVHSHGDRAAAEAVAAEVRARGVASAVALADVGRPEEADALVESTVSAFGRLDILVSNAARRREKPVTEITYEEWREVLSVALDGAFLVARAAIPHIVAAGGGSIVTIGGSPSHMGTRNRAHVLASKMGLVGLTRGMAAELGEHGINVNCVAPGQIDTVRGASAGTRNAVTHSRPVARAGTPHEVAAMVRHLCRPEGAYVTGQTIHVNGGMLMAGA